MEMEPRERTWVTAAERRFLEPAAVTLPETDDSLVHLDDWPRTEDPIRKDADGEALVPTPAERPNTVTETAPERGALLGTKLLG